MRTTVCVLSCRYCSRSFLYGLRRRSRPNRIDTNSYCPQQVVFAPDHTIWTAGFKTGNDGAEDFKILHHYARTEEELGQALSWAQIGGALKQPGIESIGGGQFLYVANDRIGWDEGCTAVRAPGSKSASPERGTGYRS